MFQLWESPLFNDDDMETSQSFSHLRRTTLESWSRWYRLHGRVVNQDEWKPCPLCAPHPDTEQRIFRWIGRRKKQYNDRALDAILAPFDITVSSKSARYKTKKTHFAILKRLNLFISPSFPRTVSFHHQGWVVRSILWRRRKISLKFFNILSFPTKKHHLFTFRFYKKERRKANYNNIKKISVITKKDAREKPLQHEWEVSGRIKVSGDRLNPLPSIDGLAGLGRWIMVTMEKMMMLKH